MRESGDILLSGAVIYAELGELLSSTLPLPPEGIRVFKSLGLAVADLAAARLVYFAAKHGAGLHADGQGISEAVR